ncbi:class I SAM-dependent DNA methyltransferase [Thermodesulforhabdus norvegica]|uniref:Methyltransferase domain-containing protein n=1 Tax=Thermodesulforhabdus norvegica TaxID=39841 RepID=A0A1I4W478_9BACT|nr:class I SAM-dependent methyltransferase [Thermodesulforhabdus norvegica]SFN08026.1 Methyltransferase domain-containing protein [Thermodesulforhabdus norvegica]
MQLSRYNIKFPLIEPNRLDQDEAFFFLLENGNKTRIRFHDYAEIYKRPGLYEQLFYRRLKCCSPQKVVETLAKVLRDNLINVTELRVLDLGAGNGMVGEQLHAHGVARVVGVDIVEEAHRACERDRPGIYDAYYVCDFTKLEEAFREHIASWQFNCLTCVAALGFGDIPVRAFANAFNLVCDSGWIAFNIKDSFVLKEDRTGFSRLIRTLINNGILEIHHLERYRHRISIDGRPLFYYAIVGRKMSHIPDEMVNSIATG